jgi:hypothetical protein
MKMKRYKAAMDNDFLLKILAATAAQPPELASSKLLVCITPIPIILLCLQNLTKRSPGRSIRVSLFPSNKGKGDLNCWSLDANRQFQPEELLTQ